MADTGMTGFLATLDATSLGLGVAAGFAVTLLFTGIAIIRLERDRATLKARMEASQVSRAELDGLFARTAQEALKNSGEQFLQLAQEKLKQAQSDGSHDLDKRHKAIQEMVKPVDEHLQKLQAAVEQLKGTDKAIRDDLLNLNRETFGCVAQPDRAG